MLVVAWVMILAGTRLQCPQSDTFWTPLRIVPVIRQGLYLLGQLGQVHALQRFVRTCPCVALRPRAGAAQWRDRCGFGVERGELGVGGLPNVEG